GVRGRGTTRSVVQATPLPDPPPQGGRELRDHSRCSPAGPILAATKCREETMRRTLPAAIGIAFAFAVPHSIPAQTQNAALTGLVSSTEEPAMEGVLVSASRAGSNTPVSVVPGADGRYSFPQSRLAPGQFALAVRGVGYDLDRPAKVDVTTPNPATADLKLRKTADLAAQL